MTIHVSTVEEIGGQITADEVLVRHLKGPYAGMTLVNKASDPTLKDALTAGEVELLQGTPAPAAPATVAGGTSTVQGGQSTVPSSDPPDTI